MSFWQTQTRSAHDRYRPSTLDRACAARRPPAPQISSSIALRVGLFFVGCATRASAPAVVFLGRGWILCSGGSRTIINRKFDSALHAFQRASSAGDGLSRGLLEIDWVRPRCDPHRYAGACCVLFTRRLPAGRTSVEPSSGACRDDLHRPLPCVLRAELTCPP